MSEPENFLERWSRRKREADAAAEAEAQGKPAAVAEGGQSPAASAAEEPAFDITKLPSLEEIVADTDVSVFMKPGVPAALRHAALRRAWSSDPAIRDFRGLQENGWDFNAPDGVPGFGTFKSEEEIKALAQRLFGSGTQEAEPVPQSAPRDIADAPAGAAPASADGMIDEDQDTRACVEPPASDGDGAPATPQAENVASQRNLTRRHGGALPH